MATPTYTLIDSVTLTSSASSVTFSAIPAGGDLVLIMDMEKSSAGQEPLYYQFNGDSTYTNYTHVRMLGDGSSATSGTTGANLQALPRVTNAAGNLTTMQIMDYSATDKHKTSLIRANVTSGALPGAMASATRWANTSAVTSISILIEPGANFASGSTFYLYGIEA